MLIHVELLRLDSDLSMLDKKRRSRSLQWRAEVGEPL